MPVLLDILSGKLNGEIRDDAVAMEDITRLESRIGRTLAPQFSNLLLAANGLSFHPPAIFRGSEVLGIFSLWQIERTIQTLGEFIPGFLLPFAHSLTSYYCFDSGEVVYDAGVGDQIPRIVINPTLLSLKMFIEELNPSA